MLYPRTTRVGDKQKLVDETAMVCVKEHLSSKHRIVNMYGEISWELDSMNLLLAFDSMSHDPIKVIISSPGGNLDTAFLIHDTIKMINSPVYTIGVYCTSAAAMLLASGTKRYLMPHAKVMLHLPSGGMMGATPEMEIYYKRMQQYKDELIQLLQQCGVKRSREKILEDIDRDRWMTPKEAIEYGLADEVIEPDTLRGWLK